MNPDFLLDSPLAQKLYNYCAKNLPIIDYHNHIDISCIVEDRQFENITQLWISTDPYKHRAMRILGIKEYYITGGASDYEKFCVWYEHLPNLIGNPLFDWSYMELSKIFDYEMLPFEDAKMVWNILNEKLKNMSAKSILAKFNIEYSAPCASILDDVSVFDKTENMSPSLRGDDIIVPTKDFIEKLGNITKKNINTLVDYIDAIYLRLSVLKKAGCKFSDHALDNGFQFLENDGNNEKRFEKLLLGEILKEDDAIRLQSYILFKMASFYAERNMCMQLHIGAQRYTSSRLRSKVGPAGGFAAIGNLVEVKSLTNFLDSVEKTEAGLPRILLFTLNPADNAVMATLSGSYAKAGHKALVSQGPAWWWCDHYRGITQMLSDFMSYSVLSTFVGMTTDSRSILSFVRHDYFRRVLCEWVADMTEKGRFPNDFALLSETVEKICYKNAKEILGGFLK